MCAKTWYLLKDEISYLHEIWGYHECVSEDSSLGYETVSSGPTRHSVRSLKTWILFYVCSFRRHVKF
jgi:hypothetical protein